MNLEYAKELLAVDCQRVVETLRVLDANSDQLTHEQVLVKNRLQADAEEAMKVFKHPEGSIG